MASASGKKAARKPRVDREKRRTERMAKLASGRIQANRKDRWAVRRRIAGYTRAKLADWLLYAIYEHLLDLASPSDSSPSEAHLYSWELAEDLHVSRATISRWVARLEVLGLLKVKWTASDCSPNIFTLLKPE